MVRREGFKKLIDALMLFHMIFHVCTNETIYAVVENTPMSVKLNLQF